MANNNIVNHSATVLINERTRNTAVPLKLKNHS
jgi:hypothetical protein